MPLPVIKEETSDLEGSDSEKPPTEQPTRKGLKYPDSSPSSTTHCLACINGVMQVLGGKKRGVR